MENKERRKERKSNILKKDWKSYKIKKNHYKIILNNFLNLNAILGDILKNTFKISVTFILA